MPAAPQLSAYAIPGIPLIQAGDDIVDIMLEKARAAGIALQGGDVLVVSSKIVSKAAGRLVCLDTVRPSSAAADLAVETDKDPRLVELILSESEHVSRKRRGVLVTKHRLGFVSANAGIDQSNIEGGDERALLLPINPDQAASAIREEIQARLGLQVGVIISDTHGRPFRVGNIGVAIGVAGLPASKDLRGSRDLYGRILEITQVAYADLVASAAHLLCGEADEGLPAVLLRGLDVGGEPGCAADLIRAPEHDMYR
ncbi:MAG: coenzyme F420-0:L-glutamate ligase [Chloroflexi bacterium]|nr:coenzyme F420-0:L-glutamate ligase [Chloroflexota bacterium]MCY3583415.1 coenzyme F420-0:L-glutamate ligase [Chloroflexota bacterium]